MFITDYRCCIAIYKPQPLWNMKVSKGNTYVSYNGRIKSQISTNTGQTSNITSNYCQRGGAAPLPKYLVQQWVPSGSPRKSPGT